MKTVYDALPVRAQGGGVDDNQIRVAAVYLAQTSGPILKEVHCETTADEILKETYLPVLLFLNEKDSSCLVSFVICFFQFVLCLTGRSLPSSLPDETLLKGGILLYPNVKESGKQN